MSGPDTMSSTTILDQLEAAFGRLGLRIERLDRLPSVGQKRGRRAYRVETHQGHAVKARWLETEDVARRLVDLRAALEPAFAPVIGRVGQVILEAWIEGTPLPEPVPETLVQAAGELLGRHHATEPPEGRGVVRTAEWQATSLQELDALRERGTLEASVADRLQRVLEDLDPGVTPAALLHGDFCSENMILDRAGRLAVIDNEWQSIGPPGLDLGRTFSRWRMAPSAWQVFVRSHDASAQLDTGALDYWKVVATLWGARIRRDQRPDRLAPAIDLLRRLAAECSVPRRA